MPRIEIETLEQDADRDEVSFEAFDRVAFAERAVALVRPAATRVAICGGARKLRVETGRQWGKGAGRWAIVEVTPHSSRRAIAHAVLAICEGQAAAWTLDVLMGTCEES